jgi:hypothetical protein
LNIIKLGAGGAAQVVKHLPSTCETLSPYPILQTKKEGRKERGREGRKEEKKGEEKKIIKLATILLGP